MELFVPLWAIQFKGVFSGIPSCHTRDITMKFVVGEQIKWLGAIIYSDTEMAQVSSIQSGPKKKKSIMKP